MARGLKTIGLVLAAGTLVTSGGLLTAAQAGGPESGWWVSTSPQATDSEVNATGEPHRGTDADGDVVGYVDAHTHMFMNLGMGGNAVCGSVWSEQGIADALKDCANHRVSILENLTNSAAGRGILDAHDTVGWPTFRDWPTYSSLTHQQMYYKWVERAWRGGQRIMVNDMVSNPGLCPILGVVAGPNTYSCDDMDTVRREIQATYDLQAFVDRQYGGTGRGWYRVVTTPEQARTVVQQGKLAVVLGVEVSEPFGCKQVLGVPQCTRADIDRGLDELKAKGVSSMFLCHKFDNALCGVRYDEGTTGLLVNAGQFITTGTWWNPKTCKAGETPDHTVIGGVLPKELSVPGLPAAAPLYPVGPHCNPLGLTDLGEYALRGMIKRDMMVELDHMSAKASGRALDILESEGYPGAISSHDWMPGNYTDRLYALGGFATQYGHDAESFVKEWNDTKAVRDKYGVGYGYGTDMNGFGGTAAPPATAAAKISYPFTAPDGTTFTQQVTGQRTWDYNTDGVAHYGLLPDWVESVRKVGGQAVVDDLNRGAESYLRTWGATTGYTPGANLALQGRTTASSYQWDLLTNYRADRATDGSLSTRWSSAWGKNQEWLQVDLGTVRQVSKVTIEWERAYAKAYRLQVSNDGRNWTDAVTVTGGDGGTDVLRPNTSARYVRFKGNERATIYGYSIKEFGIFS